MNISEKTKVSNALGAKTARACDSCLLKRARWFCASDDAFLCQACDASVHSANQLASRHERVRLETSTFKCREVNSIQPAWHQGFTRKARTPRRTKKKPAWPADHPLPLVPEINGDQDPFNTEENEDQLLYRVPVFDPFADDHNHDLNLEELADFAADVENLLGNNEDLIGNCGISDGQRVKVEEDEDDEVQAVIACHFDPALDMELNWDFDYESSMTGEEDMKKEAAAINNTTSDNNMESGLLISESQVVNNKRMLLRLNYEAVIAAWATQGSPWTNGIRPQFNNIDEFMVACLGGVCDNSWGGVINGGRWGISDAEREARVSRYREKRRTRLFSKKIRYQVRKLNAEKRPRMKGRFVKRPTFSPSSFPNYLINK